MTSTKKLMTLREMEPIAREATRKALTPYKGSRELEDENLTLGKSIDGPEGIFELYLAAERPQDARVICCATVDRRTGEVQVEVFLKKGQG